MDITLTKVSSKGQIVIPQELREDVGIKKGEKLLVFTDKGTIVLKKIDKSTMTKTFEEITKSIRKQVKKAGITRKDVEKAIQGVRK